MSASEPFADMTALVLDENHYHRAISIDQLRSMGFRRTFGVADAMEAWESLKVYNPNIVLLEWSATSAGLDFVRRVRMSEEAPNRAVPIFMLTNRGNLTDVEIARKAGVDGYLRKPISAGALQQRVKVVIENPQPFVVTASYVGPCRRRRRRIDAHYDGPRRRLDDPAPPQPQLDLEQADVKSELAKARMAALDACARTFQPGDAAAARTVFQAANALLEVAEQIGDVTVAFGAKEMMRYLQAHGATSALDPEVVRTHVAALHQLVHLPAAMGAERESVAQSLKRMVDKKLRQASAA